MSLSFRHLQMLLCLTLTAAITAGCDSEKIQDAEHAVADAQQATVDAAADAAADMKDSAADATEKVGDAAAEMKENVSEGLTAAWDKATTALKDVEGGGELLTGIKDFVGSAKEAMEGVSDEATAEKAKQKLGELGGNIEGWGEKIKGMSDESKTAIRGFIDQGIAQLNAMVEKFSDNETVQNVIKPKVDELIEKLKSLTASS